MLPLDDDRFLRAKLFDRYRAAGWKIGSGCDRMRGDSWVTFEAEPEQTTCRVLIGQATHDVVGERFVTRCLGDHVLKGKGEPVTIYRVLGSSPAAAPAPANALGLRRGVVAFKILEVGDDPDGGGNVLPNLVIEFVDPALVDINNPGGVGTGSAAVLVY